MIRRALIVLERWIFDDESFFLSFAKFALVILVVTGALLGPFIYASIKADQEWQAQCLASGKAWAIVGSHQVTTLMPVGKVFVPRTYTVTDYGCVEISR